jgi:hypothetical protein
MAALVIVAASKQVSLSGEDKQQLMRGMLSLPSPRKSRTRFESCGTRVSDW